MRQHVSTCAFPEKDTQGMQLDVVNCNEKEAENDISLQYLRPLSNSFSIEQNIFKDREQEESNAVNNI